MRLLDSAGPHAGCSRPPQLPPDGRGRCRGCGLGARERHRDEDGAGNPAPLKFYNLHTGEQLDVVYFEKGHYIPQALAKINYILRDYRENAVKPISPALLDLVFAIRRKLHTDAEVQIVSGYRTPETNAMLAARSDGVAHHSLHMDGLALDWRVPDRTLDQLHRVALAIRGGGVGYYPASDFVHTDVGRVRYW